FQSDHEHNSWVGRPIHNRDCALHGTTTLRSAFKRRWARPHRYRWRIDGSQNGAGQASAGTQVSEEDGSKGKDLEERTRQDNSNLQLLIDMIGGLLAASAELLARLQLILSAARHDEHPDTTGDPDEPTSSDCQHH